MKIVFEVLGQDANDATTFFRKWSNHPFVLARVSRNVDRQHEPPTREIFWDALASALLTTQQRSGPDAPITRLIRATPFPLSLDECAGHPDVGGYVEGVLKSVGGIRRGPTIGKELEENLQYLQARGWAAITPLLKSLDRSPSPKDERAAARFLADHLKGVGPKQSRNILQMLGLTQFETPLDSRVAKWLNSFGFPVRLSATSLSDPDYYDFVSDGFQALCAAAGILPCAMDAAIFVSFDRGEYGEEVMRW
jgi:hypothetical protein